MKKLFVAMATVATVALTGPALADTDEGRVTQIKQWNLALDRAHQFFTVRNAAILKDLKPGDRVRVEYAMVEGERELIKVEKLPQ